MGGLRERQQLFEQHELAPQHPMVVAQFLSGSHPAPSLPIEPDHDNDKLPYPGCRVYDVRHPG